MSENPVLLELDGPLAQITLNRPEKLNALDLQMVERLDATAAEVAAEAGVKVVVIRGAGRAFCAGLDLDMMARQGMPPDFYEVQERSFRRLELMDKITIAVLHGFCLGGGVQLAVSCDIRVAGTDCRIGLPAVNEGLFPGMAPFRLPRLIGLGSARRLILSGEMIGSDEALRLGLVDHLVEAVGFDAGLNEAVARYLEAPRAASIASKHLMRQALDHPFEKVYEASRKWLVDCLASKDVEVARQAWLRRRAEKQQGKVAPPPSD
jgi:enoyl-CoA hydratase/carnithine racemase